jgi:L,D-transpeptidase ErfK/SrfK
VPVAERSDLTGRLAGYQMSPEDTLVDLALDKSLGFVALVAANPRVDPWLPRPGELLTLPTANVLPDAPREGIVVNLGELKLYYFPEKGAEPHVFPIGIGQDGLDTPMGTTTVVRKDKDPAWYPTENMRKRRPELPAMVAPGPDNPLGAYSLRLGWPAYLIHGTNTPYGVGRRVSSGCIRLYPDDIEKLFGMVSVGTKVTVVNQPVKLGWHEGELYIQVHWTLQQVDEIEERRGFTQETVEDLHAMIREAAREHVRRVDWDLAELAAAERRGIPVRITRPAAPLPPPLRADSRI